MLPLRPDEKKLLLVCPLILGPALYVGMGGDWIAALTGIAMGPFIGLLIILHLRIFYRRAN